MKIRIFFFLSLIHLSIHSNAQLVALPTTTICYRIYPIESVNQQILVVKIDEKTIKDQEKLEVRIKESEKRMSTIEDYAKKYPNLNLKVIDEKDLENYSFDDFRFILVPKHIISSFRFAYCFYDRLNEKEYEFWNVPRDDIFFKEMSKYYKGLKIKAGKHHVEINKIKDSPQFVSQLKMEEDKKHRIKSIVSSIIFGSVIIISAVTLTLWANHLI
jgi:hypothetical protein